MKYLSKDLWIGVLLLIGSGLYWLKAKDIPISPLDGAVNAAVVPQLLAFALAFLSVLLILQALARAAWPAGQVEELDSTAVDAKAAGSRSVKRHARALGLLVLGALYLLVLPWLGYPIAVALLMGSVALYMGAAWSWRFALTIVALALTYQLVFVELLHIQLPQGFLSALRS